MADKKFEAIMTLLVPQVVQLICENDSVDEVTASRAFYESKVYALLEQEGLNCGTARLRCFICTPRRKKRAISRFRRRCTA